MYLSFVKTLEIRGELLGISLILFFIPLVCIGNIFGNNGKLFYSQTRFGTNGFPFEKDKFRPIKRDSESNGAVCSTKGDIRIILFGKFLRKTRIDELPQFLNILKDDMAVLKPCPKRSYFVAERINLMAYYATRHILRSGLTGWFQVNYFYGEPLDDSLIKLQYDFYCIKYRSIFLGLNTAIKTLSTVLFFRGQ